MRRVTCTICLLAFAIGCQPSPQSTAALRSPSQAIGKIPITTKSEEARAIFLRGRTLNENLQPHEAFLLFQQAVALDSTFAFGEYSLAATSPTAKERDGHLKTALALSGNASSAGTTRATVKKSRWRSARAAASTSSGGAGRNVRTRSARGIDEMTLVHGKLVPPATTSYALVSPWRMISTGWLRTTAEPAASDIAVARSHIIPGPSLG